ncbi:hypothetical protein GQX74_005610 [Glossina fuscipes]|nr:hypothetical protein GQX74_005610 [Glossina fuscipes]
MRTKSFYVELAFETACASFTLISSISFSFLSSNDEEAEEDEQLELVVTSDTLEEDCRSLLLAAVVSISSLSSVFIRLLSASQQSSLLVVSAIALGSSNRAGLKRTITAVILSQPVPSPMVFGAKQASNSSSHICEIFLFLSLIRKRTKFTTSSLDMKFQMPSQAKTINSSSGVTINFLTSGKAEIICSSAGKVKLIPSLIACHLIPLELTTTQRESPALATYKSRPTNKLTTAVQPLSLPGSSIILAQKFSLAKKFNNHHQNQHLLPQKNPQLPSVCSAAKAAFDVEEPSGLESGSKTALFAASAIIAAALRPLKYGDCGFGEEFSFNFFKTGIEG